MADDWCVRPHFCGMRRIGKSLWVHDPQLPTWLIFVGAFLLLFLLMDRQVDIYDEGFILVAAMRTEAGAVAHRDYYYLYGPASPWLLARFWQIFTPTFLIGRIYGLLIQAGIVAAGFHLLRPLTSLPLRLIYLLVALSWLVALQNHLYPSFACILLFLVAAHVLLRSDPLRPTTLSLLAAGGCAGLATLFRYDTGPAIVVAEAVYLILLPNILRCGNTSMAVMGRRLLLIGAGFASVVVPLIIAGWQAGAAQAWWQDIIMSSTTFYVSHRGLPFPSLSEVVRRPSFGSAYLPLAALLIGACTWLSRPTAAPQSRARHTDTVAAGLLMSCLTAAMYYKGVVRVQPLHFAMSTIPATLLLLLCAQAWQRRAGRVHAATILLGLMVIVPSAHAIGSALKRSTSEPGRLMASWLLGQRTSQSSPIKDCGIAARLMGVQMAEGQLAASAFVRNRTHRDEPVFVGAARHDLFVINNVALYFVMNRSPATHWYTFDPGLQTRADIQTAIVRDLKRFRVRWIISDSSKDHVTEPNASSVSSGVTMLDRWIARNYRVVRRFPPATIWLRNGEAGVRLDPHDAACRRDRPVDT
ncbi:MAG TPA: hypothetical protein VF637_14515 [Sphingomicrobium sp.]